MDLSNILNFPIESGGFFDDRYTCLIGRIDEQVSSPIVEEVARLKRRVERYGGVNRVVVVNAPLVELHGLGELILTFPSLTNKEVT